MGNAIYTRISRPFRSFNIENRTERILSREKPIPAPQHPSVQKQKEIVDKVNPNFMGTHYKKDVQLDDKLKRVFVESIDPESKQKTESTSSKPLPQHRGQFFEEDYDLSKSLMGKCSITAATEFIYLHYENPAEYSVERISQKYQMDKETVENILMNFKPFKGLQYKPQEQEEK